MKHLIDCIIESVLDISKNEKYIEDAADQIIGLKKIKTTDFKSYVEDPGGNLAATMPIPYHMCDKVAKLLDFEGYQNTINSGKKCSYPISIKLRCTGKKYPDNMISIPEYVDWKCELSLVLWGDSEHKHIISLYDGIRVDYGKQQFIDFKKEEMKKAKKVIKDIFKDFNTLSKIAKDESPFMK